MVFPQQSTSISELEREAIVYSRTVAEAFVWRSAVDSALRCVTRASPVFAR